MQNDDDNMNTTIATRWRKQHGTTKKQTYTGDTNSNPTTTTLRHLKQHNDTYFDEVKATVTTWLL